MKRSIILILLFVSYNLHAQIPEGYYDSAEGLVEEELREELSNIIDGHSSQSYASIWTHFQSTDVKPDGDVWDMYSDVPDGTPDYTFTFVSDQCGNYGQEGDCYNREHSFPKSWFGDASPMRTDLFHIVATDGYVNGKRSNFPYGSVDNPTWTSTNGSLVGPCAYPGYTGTVFEPIDEYKGDFARGYFYMLTRYMDNAASWNSEMLDGNNFSDWALNLLLDWSEQDSVSQKEIDRNNEIYLIQDNRNPYIDHPEFIQLVWDNTSSVAEEELITKLYYQSNTLHFKSNYSTLTELHVFTITGSLVSTFTVNEKEENFSLYLKDGIYLIDMVGRKDRISKKIMVVNQ